MRSFNARPLAVCFCVVVSAGVILTLASSAPAAEKAAADYLPSSIVGVLEMPQPGKVLDVVVEHPLTAQVIGAPEYQAVLARPEYQKFATALAQFEKQLERPWREAAAALTGGGLTAAFDLPTQGVVVLAQAKDAALAEKARNSLVDLARAAAADGGNPDAVQADEHRGVTLHKIGPGYLAVRDQWLIVSNKQALMYSVLDQFLEPGETLGADEQYRQVRDKRPGDAAAWLYVDLRVLRLTGILKKALNKKSDNPPAELLAGGILGALPDAPYVTAALEVSPTRIKLTSSLPCETKSVAKSREFYLGPEATGAAPPLLKPAGTLLALSAYRDFASLWRHAPDLFDEGINAKFAEAESGLTTFFAGRNFRDDILAKIEPGLQLVVARQEFPQEGITPAIKLPAVAAVFRMKQPAETTRILKVTFQSAVGFINIAGGMNGVDPLDVNSEKLGEALVVAGTYLPPKEEKSRGEAALHYNASPTVAFVGDRFILSSARPLALELVKQAGASASGDTGINTRVELDAVVGQAALAENRGPLIAQNMLEKGHDRSAAEREIDRLLKALQSLSASSLALHVADSRLELVWQIDLAGNSNAEKK
jgi:hypothetical protein